MNTKHRKTLPTHDELLEMGANPVVCHINHREFVKDGIRYFCGWDSQLNPKTNEVYGWITYKTEKESG